MNPLPAVVFTIVMLCWAVFGVIFLFRKRPPRGEVRKREKSFVAGFALQGLGFFLVWTFARTRFSSLVEMNFLLELILALITIGVACGSTWLVMSAVNTLGKQWSLAARLVEGHALITEGPYSRVRHPIYTGMLGLLLATGLAMSHWFVLAPALIAFWLGTVLRTRSEEKLLREEFGAVFEEYARRVPALIPRFSWRAHHFIHMKEKNL